MWYIGAQAYAYYDSAKCEVYYNDFSIVEMARSLEESDDIVSLCDSIYLFVNAWRRFENVGNFSGAGQDLNDAIKFGTETLQIISKDYAYRSRLLY